MDYEELLPDWDRDDLSKRAALDARLQDVALQHLANDPLYPSTVAALAEDLMNDDEVRAMLNSACTILGNMAVWMYGGRESAIERFAANLRQLRTVAMKGAES